MEEMYLDDAFDDIIMEDAELKRVGLELMFMTNEKCSSAEGISAVELAKITELDAAIVKKKLRILQKNELVRSIGINPKFWKFDDYKFQRMDENNEVYRLLTCFDEVDFDRYFEY